MLRHTGEDRPCGERPRFDRLNTSAPVSAVSGVRARVSTCSATSAADRRAVAVRLPASTCSATSAAVSAVSARERPGLDGLEHVCADGEVPAVSAPAFS